MKKLIGLIMLMIMLVACQPKDVSNGSKGNSSSLETHDNTQLIEEQIMTETVTDDEVVEDETLEEELSEFKSTETIANESLYEGFKRIDLFGEYLKDDGHYEITCIGRMYDQLYFVVEDLDLTQEKGSVDYELYRVSYDYEVVSAVGVIECDYVPRQENAVYMTIPDSKYDLEEIIVYSDDSVYFYDLKGSLSRSYVVFGEGDAPWNNSLDPVGELKEWYVFSGMTIIIYRDDEGVKFYNSLNESSELLDIVLEISDDWEVKLQSYIDEFFGKNMILINDNLYTGNVLSEEIKGLKNFNKVLYEDKKEVLLLMKEPSGKVFFLKVDNRHEYIETRTLEFELYTFVQREEANMQIDATTKLSKPHWSDDLMVRFLDIYDPVFERKIKRKFPTAVLIKDDNDIVFTTPVGESSKFEIAKDLFEEDGYLLEEDIHIQYSGKNLKYHMVRWNRDRTEKLLYARDIEDDYFAVELDFYDEIINHERIEETIVDNINYYRVSQVKPDIEFEWLDKQRVFVTVTNMEGNQDYVISLNGYITDDGTCHYTWSSCHGYIGALEEYYEGFYDFTKVVSDNAKCVKYDLESKQETELGTIHHYDYLIGPSVGNLVSVALPDEWGYYTYIYDMEKNQIHDHDLHCSYYQDYYEYKSELYFIGNNGIYRIEENGDMTSVYETEGEETIYTVRKHPTLDLFCVMIDKDYKDIALYILDENYSLISQVSIEYYRLGFYGILVEPYWLDEDSVMITGGIDDEFNSSEFYTNVYNIYTGEIEDVIENEKIMTISDDGEFILTQNIANDRIIKTYNRSLELQGEKKIETTSDNSSYQYMDYWYGHILYIKYYDKDEVFKWNLDTNEMTILELPYDNFVIDKVLGEDYFRLFINIEIIKRSNPWWS